MPVIYKSFQSVLANKEGKKLFYPRVVLTGNVDTEQVAKEIAELSSLSTGDSKNVIDNLVQPSYWADFPNRDKRWKKSKTSC